MAAQPTNLKGLFCPTCSTDFEYKDICHRMCIKCNKQFPVELHSGEMRKFPNRPELVEFHANSAAGVLGTGGRAPATIAAAVAVMAIDASQGKDKAAGGRPKAKSSAAGRVANDAEQQKKREALRTVWLKWEKIHSGNIQDGGKTIESDLDNLTKPKIRQAMEAQ